MLAFCAVHYNQHAFQAQTMIVAGQHQANTTVLGAPAAMMSHRNVWLDRVAYRIGLCTHCVFVLSVCLCFAFTICNPHDSAICQYASSDVQVLGFGHCVSLMARHVTKETEAKASASPVLESSAA